MPKSRTIAEFGCGRNPYGLISKAQKAKETNRNRTFVGVDFEAAEAKRTARILGLKRVPENAAFIQGDAIDSVKKFDPKSKDLIFASNLFTRNYLDYSVSQGVTGALYRKTSEFLREAKKALKQNGRIVLVQGKIDAPFLKLIGETEGYKVHVKELTEMQAQKSLAPFIRKVSTLQRRDRRRTLLYGPKSDITTEDLKPTIVILRK